MEIVGGEQYILSAVMHADERNQAMSEALGEDVYHYHLHVVYIPVVEKQILWSKRCKDEALRGTVKEVITQVSRSKKWESKPVLDKDGNPMLNARGKKILRSSYSVLQDDFFHFMRVAGYTDLEFCEWMIKNIGVAAVPGSSFFRENVNNLIRLHFAREEKTIDEALARLKKLKELL